MNINHLITFCHVVEQKSITEAAKRTYISQPAVTKQIKQLETHYKTLLFDRKDGKLHLNESGRILYPFAKDIIDSFHRSQEEITALIHEQNIQLHVGASLTIGEYLLPQLISKFKATHPINFNITIGNTPTVLQKLDQNQIDFALVESDFKEEGYVKTKLAEDKLILVAPASHRWRNKSIQFQDLIDEKIIWREKDSGTRLLIETEFKKQGILDQIENTLELGSIQSIKSAVEYGLGISILPEITVKKELQHHILTEINIIDFHLTRSIWIVEKSHRFPKRGSYLFKNFILDYLQN